MTRKRFVKLLMAKGYSRNDANEIAEGAREDGSTYAEGFDQVTRLLPAFQDIMPRIVEAIQVTVDAIWKMSCAMVEATKAFCDTFQDAMSRT